MLLGFLSAFPLGVFSQEDQLISGPGSTLTGNKCKICHELQHIRRAELSPGEWLDNLRNMKERGAPMTDEEMAVMHKYLSTYYNRGVPAPAPGPDTLAAGGADPMEKLLNANACTGCHAMDARVVGPSFREISRKYRNDSETKSLLARKIRGGGQGTWGNVPMPPNPGVSESDAHSLVEWILSRK